MCFEGSALMQLHGAPHDSKEPTVVPMPTYSASFRGEDVFDHALHGLDGLVVLLAQTTIDGPIQDIEYPLAFRGLVTILARCVQQGHPTLPLKLGKQIFIIRILHPIKPRGSGTEYARVYPD
jgi:hypothetical protein